LARTSEPAWGYDSLKAWFTDHQSEEILETELLKAFFVAPFDGGVGLELFQKHFLLFRRLWQFDDELRTTTGERLWIRGIRVTLLGAPAPGQCGWLDLETGNYCGKPGPGLCVDHSRPLPEANTTKSYYLDATNLEGMTEQGVEDLMKGFFHWWGRREALETLGLPIDADDGAVKARWRQLSLEHHPDRGGDSAEFQRLSAAVAALRQGR